VFEAYRGPIEESPIAPWGVQVAGNFSKEIALASYARAFTRHGDILGEVVPMVIGTRLRSRGTQTCSIPVWIAIASGVRVSVA